jgi:hypothetical protein
LIAIVMAKSLNVSITVQTRPSGDQYQ